MAEWLEGRIHIHKIMGSSPAQTSWLIKKRPTQATSDDNGASGVHSAINEYLAIDRDGSCILITRGAFKPVSGCILPRYR